MFAQVRERYGFALVGYVVMPEHVHLLMGEPVRGTPSTVIQVLKQRVPRRLRGRRGCSLEQLVLSFESDEIPLRRFWQRRFFDFNVWSLKKRIEKLDYMDLNPFKRKLVERPKDWPWSSFSFYANTGKTLIAIDPVR
jgi:putative transposase